MGAIFALAGSMSAWGPLAAGAAFDLTGSYRLAFLASIASYLIGCGAFWALRRPPARPVV